MLHLSEKLCRKANPIQYQYWVRTNYSKLPLLAEREQILFLYIYEIYLHIIKLMLIKSCSEKLSIFLAFFCLKKPILQDLSFAMNTISVDADHTRTKDKQGRSVSK